MSGGHHLFSKSRSTSYSHQQPPPPQQHQQAPSNSEQVHLENLHSLGLLPRRVVLDPQSHHPKHHGHSKSSSYTTQSSSNKDSQTSASHRQASSHTTDSHPTREPSKKAKSSKRHLGYASVGRTWQPPPYSNGTQTSFNWRSGRPMAGMLELERSRTRRERTFIGSECAVCEEPLEHTLRGERILQFSCGHVSHEACFYEYIKEFDTQYCPTCNAPLGLDTSRGGNVLDLEKLSSIVRSVSLSNEQREQNRSSQNTPTQWDNQTVRDRPRSRESNPRQRDSKDSRDYQRDYQSAPSVREGKDAQRERIERYGSGRGTQHARQGSNGTGTGPGSSQGDYAEHGGRRHDYDVQAMETDLSSPRISVAKRPIPPPSVAVRSEYPTLTRSKQSQTLTCLITVEVPEGKWQPDPEDLRGAPPLPTHQNHGHHHHHQPSHQQEKEVVHALSPEESQAEWLNESPEELEEITEDLRNRVENWHGLDFSRFGKLRLHGQLRVSRDRASWQELECFLFAEMLICIKEKRGAQPLYADGNSKRKLTKCTLRGSILIRKHLKEVESSPDEPVLCLSLAVQELPQFHLQFSSRAQQEQWRRAFLMLNAPQVVQHSEGEPDLSGTDEEDFHRHQSNQRRVSSVNSSWGPSRSVNTAPTEYSAPMTGDHRGPPLPASIHVPLDLVAVIPVSSSMQGLKITLLRDALRFLVQNLGPRDRMGLVTFGSSGGGVPLVGMTTKTWGGWNKVLNSIRPVGQKSLRADVVEGANVAMDLLMQRKSNNPIATILLISDSSTSDGESVDFVVSRAEAAKIAIHSFGLGLTHKPDTMIELSTRTKASYTYVKDWMMLRECVAGCLGSLQTTSHQNAKLKLRLPEGSPAKFAKISGALQITKRTAGREAEAALGDLRFGDKRDILVQLVIAPDNSSEEHLPQDHWESIVSGLEALGGSYENDDGRVLSVEEVPLIQADLSYGDILREGTLTHLPRPSLLAITMLPASSSSSKSPKGTPGGRPPTPPIPPHPSIVQRRMELLTSDMLTRALGLVSKGHHERANHLLHETRSILKGLAKGGLPPLPPQTPKTPTAPTGNGPGTPNPSVHAGDSPDRLPSPLPPSSDAGAASQAGTHGADGTPRMPPPSAATAPGVDPEALAALDTELESSLEWIGHPAVFGRDSRKAVLQAIGVISSQRGYTFRTPSESLWAGRVGGIKSLTARSREWREVSEGEALPEES